MIGCEGQRYVTTVASRAWHGVISAMPHSPMLTIVSSMSGHAVWVSAEMYSAPSIVLQSRRQDGGMHVFDDFREAYAWLRHNTDPSAKVLQTPPLSDSREHHRSVVDTAK